MNDDQKDTHISTAVDERPIDPTRNAEDLQGDTSGMTGVTRGTSEQTSAEPSEIDKDTSYFRGGTIEDVQTIPSGIEKSAINDDAYKKEVVEGMSTERAEVADDIASEPADVEPTAPEKPIEEPMEQSLPDHNTQTTPYTTTEEAPYNHPYNKGEQSVSGTTSDVEADDDTLANAQDAGFQPHETTENPQEIDAARDIDRAEENLRNS